MATFNTYRKRREIVILGIEATRGVTSTDPYSYRWLTKGLKDVPSILENESAIGADARVNDSAIDVWHSEGPLGGKVTEGGIARLIHGMLNKVTTTDNGDGTFTHHFTRDPNAPRKTFTIWDLKPGGTRRYNSMTLDNLNLNVDVGDSGAWLESEVSAKGWKSVPVAAPTPAFDNTEKEYTSRMVKLFIADDIADIDLSASRVKPRSITLELEEGTTVDHYVGETDNDPEFDSAPAEAKLSMVLKRRSTDYEEDLEANAIKAVKILIENGDTKIDVRGTRVRFREVTDSDGRDDIVTQTCSCYFEADTSNGGKDIEVFVTNHEASIV